MNRVVLITGAAGGIGGATAEVFTKAGWHVVGVDRREIDDPSQVAHFIRADLTELHAPEHIFEEVAKREGRLGALVNNAAMQISKPLLETTAEDWDRIMASNVRSVFLLVRQAFEMLKESQGAIVNISSVHALATSVGTAAYAASKGALLALTRAMALEFGPHRVRVNAVLPGAVDTPMLRAALGRGHAEGRSVEELVRGLGRRLVMGRVGRPEEIGRLILFLADNEQSSFMTGQAVTIDGGATARLSTE